VRKAKSSIVRIALTQMACAADPKANLAAQIRLIEQAAKRGARIVCTQELFRSQYFARSKTMPFSNWRRRFPARRRTRWASWLKNTPWSSSPRSSRNGRRAFITTRRRSSTPTGRCWACYRKMHIPDDPLYYEKFYFTPGDTGFRAWQTRYARSAC
jgi:N-carbamoylputrescine amidase